GAGPPVDARHTLVAAEVGAEGEVAGLAHEGGGGGQVGLGGGAQRTRAQGDAVAARVVGGGGAGAGQQGGGKQGGGGVEAHRVGLSWEEGPPLCGRVRSRTREPGAQAG